MENVTATEKPQTDMRLIDRVRVNEDLAVCLVEKHVVGRTLAGGAPTLAVWRLVHVEGFARTAFEAHMVARALELFASQVGAVTPAARR